MSMVYVLLKYDSSVKKEHPVGVISSEKDADSFYNQDPKNRDWIPFILDEVPEHTGTPSSYVPPKQKPSEDLHTQLDAANKRIKELKLLLNEANKRTKEADLKVQEASDKMQMMLKFLKKRDKQR
jgi:hypothetical protein